MKKSYLVPLLLGATMLIAAFAKVHAVKPKTHHRSDNASLAQLKAMMSEDDKYWLTAKEHDSVSVAKLIKQHNVELSKGILTDKLMHGDRSKKEIAITFDDGPHPRFTPKILSTLKRYNVKATFFLVGQMAERYPYLVRAEASAGHSIGNHTYHHVNLTKIPVGYVATEIGACDRVLEGILHKSPHLFRPPGGDYDTTVGQAAEALDYKLILWTDDPGDYANPGANTVIQRTLDKADNGGIILIHDGVQGTIDALPKIITTLKSKGYRFVTIDQMISGK